MTDEDTRTINRAICLVDDWFVREAARAALHRRFRYQCKLEREVERLRRDLKQAANDALDAIAEVERLEAVVEDADALGEKHAREVERLREKVRLHEQGAGKAALEVERLRAEVERLRGPKPSTGRP